MAAGAELAPALEAGPVTASLRYVSELPCISLERISEIDLWHPRDVVQSRKADELPARFLQDAPVAKSVSRPVTVNLPQTMLGLRRTLTAPGTPYCITSGSPTVRKRSIASALVNCRK